MKIAVDIDGVLATKLESGVYPDDYVKKQPLPLAKESLARLKAQGHEVYLFTARFEEDREVTEDWLSTHGFAEVYDYLIMDKPQYDILIDDRAIRHEDWMTTSYTVDQLMRSGE